MRSETRTPTAAAGELRRHRSAAPPRTQPAPTAGVAPSRVVSGPSASTVASAAAPDIFGQVAAFFGLPGAPATTAPTIASVPLLARLTVGDIFGGVAPAPVTDPSVVITGLFREMLRQDPTSQDLQSYLGLWSLTGINGVVAGLYSSTAFRHLEINSYYLEMLGRPAEQAELGWGTTALTWGLPEPLLVASIAGSSEFLADSAKRGGTYGTQPGAESVTNLLYRTLLGQSADTTEAPVYIQELQRGTPQGLVAGRFVMSDAFRQVKVNEIFTVAGLAGSSPANYVNTWFLNGGLAGIATEILTSPQSVAVLNAGVSLPDMTAVGQLQDFLLASYLKGPTVDGREAPPQFIELVQKYIGVDTNGQKCPGNTLCNTELLDLLRTSGTTRGIPNSSIDVQSINASVVSLIPTQSEIDMEKSLRFPLRNAMENGVYPLDTYLAGGLILHPAGAILTANDGTYILDGHHRWSSIYVVNPYTQVSAIDMGYVPSPQDGLKEAQMAIIARDAQLNPQLVEGVNLLDPNLQQSVFNGLVEQYIYAGPDPVRTLNVIANFLGTRTELDNPTNQPEKLQAAQDYLWSNVKRLQTYNEPYPEVTNRAYMPQPAGNQYPPYLNPLETGAISYTLPVISYLG